MPLPGSRCSTELLFPSSVRLDGSSIVRISYSNPERDGFPRRVGRPGIAFFVLAFRNSSVTGTPNALAMKVWGTARRSVEMASTFPTRERGLAII